MQFATKEQDCCKQLFSCTTTILATIKTIRNHKCEVLPHAPCSPDLSLYDFHAFGPFKEAFRGRRCGSDKVVEAVHKWIRKQPKTCFSNGIRKPCGWLQTVRGTWGTLCWKITYSLFCLWLGKRYCLYFLVNLRILPTFTAAGRNTACCPEAEEGRRQRAKNTQKNTNALGNGVVNLCVMFTYPEVIKLAWNKTQEPLLCAAPFKCTRNEGYSLAAALNF
jgi:hypothetical protein